MNNQIEDLRKKTLVLYNKNISFLKDKFPLIYQRVEKISLSIQNKTYKERYTLQYVNNYFDIFNNKNKSWYYGRNSFEDALERRNNTDFSINGSFELLRKNPTTGKLLNGKVYKDVTPIVDKINELVDFDNIKYNEIFNHIYIGVGLGVHIQAIDKLVNSRQILMIEDDIEVFRLSLFVTDYTAFVEGNKKLFLFVGEKKENFKYCLNDFSHAQPFLNFNIKYTELLTSGNEYKKEITSFFSTNSITYFPYKKHLENIDKTLDFINNKDRFLNAHTMNKKPLLSDKKVLLVAAGPSLNNYIEWIRDNQEKFIIVTVDVIVKKLEKNKIVPDIVVSIDPSHLCADYMTTEDPNYLDNSAFLFLSQQDESVMELVKGKNYYFSQSIPIVDRIGYLGSTPNVGTYSFELACYLGAKELYTIGNDAAFDQKTGLRYASDAGLILEENISNNETSSDEVSFTDVIDIEGNLRDTVKTNRSLITFKYQFENALKEFKNKGLEIESYNLSDGAKLEGFEPLAQDEFILKSKDFQKIDKKTIISGLDEVSEIITDLDYEEDIKIINSIISRTKKFQKLKISSKKDFIENKINLTTWIMKQVQKEKNKTLQSMFLEYLGLANIYINFYMNLTQKGIHTTKELSQINDLWGKGILTLFKELKESFKKMH